jgi:predicted dehydrogenase
MIDQYLAQSEDKVVEAAKHGYQDDQWKLPDGKVYRRPALEELIRWRLFDRTGGGLMAELGSHQLDAAGIFISAAHPGGEKVHPLSVLAASNRPIFGRDRDVDDHVCCIFEFPAPGYDPKDKLGRLQKIGVQYASINGNGFGGYGEIVFGTKGTLILESEKEVMLYNGGAATKIAAGAGGAMDTQESPGAMAAAAATGPMDVSRGYAEQLEHWAWCIRRNPKVRDAALQPKCHPKVALADAVIALTTNIAAKKGQRIEFKEAWFEPDSNETPEGAPPPDPNQLV